jgi:hypothetical protein
MLLSGPQVNYFLNSKRYRPSSILIHRQNLYAPRSRRCNGRHEVQSRKAVNRVKKNLYLSYARRLKTVYGRSVKGKKGKVVPVRN